MRKVVVVFAFVVGWTFDWFGRSEGVSPRQEVNVTFELYNRRNPENGAALSLGRKTTLLSSGFESSLPAVLITHGFTDDGGSNWIRATREEVLSVEDVNFITVDWSECSKNLIYNEVVDCMKEVGFRTGEFLKFLREDGNFDLGRVHMIGHSLGAHMFALAAKVIGKEATIGRITGLDPAAPLFEYAPESERLSNTSAKVVDVLHTCTVFLGMRQPIGTMDFYPNGGFNQLGCAKMNLRCHHAMSGIYFLKSISRYGYLGRKCQTLEDAIEGTCEGEMALMGYHMRYRTPGIYYVPIN